MKIVLTDAGLNPLVVDSLDSDWNKLFALLKKYNSDYTYAEVTDQNDCLEDVVIFTASRAIGHHEWRCVFHSAKYLA